MRPEWLCWKCNRWVSGLRCKLCHSVMNPGRLGYTRAEENKIAKGEADG